MKFPFREPENTAVITCCHIIENGADILYVSHDAEDGMWQFLCGNSHEITDAKLVALEEVFALDNSISRIADMPYGYIATRKNVNLEWKIHKK